MNLSTCIADLVPHQGRMCLLERIERWDATGVVAATGTHRAADHPLRSSGRLSSVHLCEYGAQAMALHGGLLARADGREPSAGLLVSVRDVHLHVEYLDELDDDLVVSAERLHASPAGMQYRFEVRHAGVLLAEGRVTAMTPAATVVADDSGRDPDRQRQA